MNEDRFPVWDKSHMHVNSDLPVELTEEQLSAQKAAVRGVLATRLEMLWQACVPYIEAEIDSGSGVRMAQLGLQVLDRIARVHEVYQPDRGGGDQGSVEVITARRREEVLKGLEDRRSFLEGEAS